MTEWGNRRGGSLVRDRLEVAVEEPASGHGKHDQEGK